MDTFTIHGTREERGRPGLCGIGSSQREEEIVKRAWDGEGELGHQWGKIVAPGSRYGCDYLRGAGVQAMRGGTGGGVGRPVCVRQADYVCAGGGLGGRKGVIFLVRFGAILGESFISGIFVSVFFFFSFFACFLGLL